jgi:hypothetical protein
MENAASASASSSLSKTNASNSKSSNNSRDTPSRNTRFEPIQLIGQGGFGCVYYRGFDARGDILPSQYVTKIAILEKSQETEIGKIIHEMPGYEAFFNVVISTEPIDLSVLSSDTQSKCNVIKRYIEKHPDSKPEFQVLKQLYVPHVTLLDFVKNRGIFMNDAQVQHVGRSALRDISEVSYSVPKFMNILINCYETLLMAVARMQAEVEVVHYDLKVQNVVLHVYTKNPIILDFGLSFSMRDVRAVLEDKSLSDMEIILKLKTFFYGFHPDYAPWAIETHIISYIVSSAHTAAANLSALPSISSSSTSSTADASAATADASAADTSTATADTADTADASAAVSSSGGRRRKSHSRGGNSNHNGNEVPMVTTEALSDLITEFIANHEYLREQPESFKRAFFERSMRIYSKSAVNRPAIQVVRDFIYDDAWKSWEIYSVATLCLDMIQEMYKAYRTSETDPYKKQIDSFCNALHIAGNYIDSP